MKSMVLLGAALAWGCFQSAPARGDYADIEMLRVLQRMDAKLDACESGIQELQSEVQKMRWDMDAQRQLDQLKAKADRLYKRAHTGHLKSEK